MQDDEPPTSLDARAMIASAVPLSGLFRARFVAALRLPWMMAHVALTATVIAVLTAFCFLPAPAAAQRAGKATLRPPETPAQEVVKRPPGNGVKPLKPDQEKAAEPAETNQVQGKARSGQIKPEMRPAAEAVTPQTSVVKEPKTYERTAPGLSATIHDDGTTSITGVVTLPGQPSGSWRPYGRPETGGKPSASGGVMLKRSF